MASSRQGNDDRDELGRSLYAARRAAGLGQVEAAKRARTSQNKVSRVENGKGLLTATEGAALLTVYGVRGDERRRIMTLAETARAGAYAHVVFTQRMTEEQAAPAIASRMQRHRMLDDPARQWVLLQTEGALRWNLGGSAVMVEQIERIAVTIDRPNVRLGIIPWWTPAQVLPLHGFHLYDRSAVVVGTRSGTAIMGERDVSDYEALFGELQRLAVFDGEARELLSRIADDYLR